MAMNEEPLEVALRLNIQSDGDIITARKNSRTLSAERGFSQTEQTLIATAVSELARNILKYAKKGDILFKITFHKDNKEDSTEYEGTGSQQPDKYVKFSIISLDEGPGIQNIDLALQDGYSTSGSLGLGLPGVKRLMDEFHIESKVGTGTTVTAGKFRMIRGTS